MTKLQEQELRCIQAASKGERSKENRVNKNDKKKIHGEAAEGEVIDKYKKIELV
jgi:hypothetical protein